MYLEHYGLKEPPFSITPDPRFVFLSERHRDALAHLLFGIGQGGGGGFVQLTGEVGTGKTTLCRLLLEQLPENTRVALVLNPRLTSIELLETIGEELHLDLTGKRGSVKALVDALNSYLLDAYAKGLRVVLIIDEAQNLSLDALEQVRLLTNLETDTQKLLQIILLGQPELRDMLARPDMRQLSQRITARFHLTPLDANETAAYLRHRYRVAGGQHLPFTPGAIKRIHVHSGGVPRLINVIAERALLGGYARDDAMVDEFTVNQAAQEALAPTARRFPPKRLAIAAAVGAALVLAALWWRPQSPPAAAKASTTATKPAAAKPVPKVDTPHLHGAEFAQRVSTADAASLPAWRQLLTLWKLPAEGPAAATAAACTPSISPGVYCLHGRARLDKLASLGRPVLLHLANEDNDAWALLLGADAVDVRLWLDGTRFDTDRISLEQMWAGEYAALWRGPDGLVAPLSIDATDASGEWLRTRLGITEANVATLEDVRQFQAVRGLLSDGVVGPETMLALSASDEGPRLQRVLE
ncbi:AAA family ATPase [Lysobacter sp. CFH 32150]|uniref:AAA family ATPase n=1 Tax=Lysobacter sp. CFH 32150 TaxID=2927128 RepID=UPI001FA7394D|nr:AAA family ATPase [Lysobacter sp. CFH 32150]MCI4569344.1 AAA family ATPase [Lysobacter sp. CFH 32150]